MAISISLMWLVGCLDQPPAESASFESSRESRSRFWRSPTPACSSNSRGRLISVHSIDHYSRWGLENYWDSWLNGLAALGYIEDNVDPDIQNGADTYKVTYCTVDFDGAPIVASGMMAIPNTWCDAPTVMYSHGTAVTRFDTPTNPDVDEVFDGPSGMVIFAGHGYIYLAPDLTGFGESTTPRHRYFHAETVARSSVDMLKAVEKSWVYKLKADGRVFSTGYSQGGHTSLAFAAEAEAVGVEIEATSAGGAIVDLEQWFEWLLEQSDNSYLAVYPTYLLLSYNDVYGDIYSDPSDAFAPPYDGTIEELFDMNHTYAEVVAGLPGSMAELLTPDFFDEIQDPDASIRIHLRENNVDDVCLDSPLRMYHMIDDDEVPHELAVDALDRLGGCNDVELIDWVDTDHLNTWHQTLPEVRDWFDSF